MGSGVEEWYLGRLITSRCRFESGLRNKYREHPEKGVLLFALRRADSKGGRGNMFPRGGRQWSERNEDHVGKPWVSEYCLASAIGEEYMKTVRCPCMSLHNGMSYKYSIH